MTTDDTRPPCGHHLTHPSECGPWLDYAESLVVAERAAALAEAADQVRALPTTVVTNAGWDKRGVLHIEHESLGTGTQMLDRAAVLAILEPKPRAALEELRDEG